MVHSESEIDTAQMLRELKKLRLESKLRKNLASEMERQKEIAVEAQELAAAKTEELDKLLKKHKLEAQLRKNLASEMERQKEIAVEAQELALEKKNEIEAISNQLSKYLSPQLYQSIFSGEQQVDIESKRKKLTIFFSDIVGFTNISDSLESEEITSMLNYYLNEMSKLALEFGGTIDKYIGDAILIFFGDPETEGVKEDAIKCVNMALAMQSRMKELENQWAEKFGLREPLEMRIGIATGYCTVGNFGSEDRLDYTVIGAQVNLASRLESIANPGSILISFDTYSQVSKAVSCIELEKVRVKGIREEVRTFEVLKDGKKTENMVDIETNNLKLSAHLDRLEIEEINRLADFVKDARKRLNTKT
ncbi:MAG: adenylate/guanylate cyclase domain-containing protein [Pseudomonadota bacterium]|nr:adenylate/guanylate cyclase domain-containing protein [Pseudomonadota bacterium]